MRSDLCTNSCSLRARRADLSVHPTLIKAEESSVDLVWILSPALLFTTEAKYLWKLWKGSCGTKSPLMSCNIFTTLAYQFQNSWIKFTLYSKCLSAEKRTGLQVEVTLSNFCTFVSGWVLCMSCWPGTEWSGGRDQGPFWCRLLYCCPPHNSLRLKILSAPGCDRRKMVHFKCPPVLYLTRDYTAHPP